MADRMLGGLGGRAPFGLGDAAQAARVAGRALLWPERGQPGDVPPPEGREPDVGGIPDVETGCAAGDRRVPRCVRSGDERRASAAGCRAAGSGSACCAAGSSRSATTSSRWTSRASAGTCWRATSMACCDDGVAGRPPGAGLRPVGPGAGDRRRPRDAAEQAPRSSASRAAGSRRSSSTVVARPGPGRSKASVSTSRGSAKRDGSHRRRSGLRSSACPRSSGAGFPWPLRSSDVRHTPVAFHGQMSMQPTFGRP